jgi:Clp amino terminal domain.
MEWKGKPISQSLEKYLNRAREIAKRRGDLVVDSDHFLASLFESKDEPFAKYLERNGLSIEAVRGEINKVLEQVWSQLDQFEKSYLEYLQRVYGSFRSYGLSNEFAELIRKASSPNKGKTVRIRVKRWSPEEEFFSEWERLISEFFGEPIGRRRWSYREETVEIPEEIYRALENKVSEDVLYEISDIYDKLSASFESLRENGFDPRRIARRVLRS